MVYFLFFFFVVLCRFLFWCFFGWFFGLVCMGEDFEVTGGKKKDSGCAPSEARED